LQITKPKIPVKEWKILPTQMEQTIPWNKLVREYFNEAEWAKGCKYQKWRKIYIMINIIE
jgi:hypothetical protein